MCVCVRVCVCVTAESPCDNFTTANGVDGGAGTASGSTYTFSCDSGYTASGVATCSLGGWDTPTCNGDAPPYVLIFTHSWPMSNIQHPTLSPKACARTHTHSHKQRHRQAHTAAYLTYKRILQACFSHSMVVCDLVVTALPKCTYVDT
jgi:hypothetical protein